MRIESLALDVRRGRQVQFQRSQRDRLQQSVDDERPRVEIDGGSIADVIKASA